MLGASGKNEPPVKKLVILVENQWLEWCNDDSLNPSFVEEPQNWD